MNLSAIDASGQLSSFTFWDPQGNDVVAEVQRAIVDCKLSGLVDCEANTMTARSIGGGAVAERDRGIASAQMAKHLETLHKYLLAKGSKLVSPGQ